MKTCVAIVVALAGSSMALGQTFTGSTITGPTFNRPVAGTPPTSLSGAGTAVRFDTLTFTVSASGSYTFQSTATSPANWDNYTFLYVNSFNPSSALANVLVGNDDNLSIGLSGFTIALTAGTTYVHVETGFFNTDFGAYSLAIRGPGTATVVPAPGAMALLGLGACAVRRRRR